VYKDVVANPDLLDSNTDIYMLSAMWFWEVNELNEIADNKENLTDVQISDDITLKINSKGLEAKKRFEIYEKLK
jgi:predicted chitinase